MACIALAKAGIRIAFPLHDAVMVECDLGDVDELSREIAGIMENAARAVLGHLIPVDVTGIKPGQTLRGKKGDAMWEIVEAALAGRRRSA